MKSFWSKALTILGSAALFGGEYLPGTWGGILIVAGGVLLKVSNGLKPQTLPPVVADPRR
jgi:hypothetical protein